MMVTSNGEVQTNEEAQENVHDLNLFVTVHLTRGHACRPVIRQALQRARKNLRVGQWSKVTSDQRVKNILCKTEHFVLVVIPGFVVKLQHKFVFYIVTAGFIYFFNSSKFTN